MTDFASRGYSCLTTGVNLRWPQSDCRIFPCREPRARHWAHVCLSQWAGMVRRAMSHMKAAISRAMAVVMTVVFFPFRRSFR